MKRSDLSPSLRALLDYAELWVTSELAAGAAERCAPYVPPGTVAQLREQAEIATAAYHRATLEWYRDEASNDPAHGPRRGS